MKFATLILGYVILFQTFDIKSLGIEWVFVSNIYVIGILLRICYKQKNKKFKIIFTD